MMTGAPSFVRLLISQSGGHGDHLDCESTLPRGHTARRGGCFSLAQRGCVVVALRDFDAYAMVRGGPRRVAVFFAVAANPLSGVLKAQRRTFDVYRHSEGTQ